MKTFLNVLYRRILYKIPLKFLLVLLAILSLGVACFSNAFDLTFSSSGYYSSSVDTYLGLSGQVVCAHTQSSYNQLSISGVSIPQYNISCAKAPVNIKGRNINYVIYDIDCGTCPSCPSCPTCDDPYTSLECQSEYSLIPISSVDSSYCESNNLCSSSECPEFPICSGGVSDFSNLYINNVLHIGAPNIIMNIPEEIDWDYAYTNSGNNMNIDVVGYNQDTDYINGVFNVQNYKPDSEDLTNIISQVLPLFVPGLVIILFIYFLFRFIKKIF